MCVRANQAISAAPSTGLAGSGSGLHRATPSSEPCDTVHHRSVSTACGAEPTLSGTVPCAVAMSIGISAAAAAGADQGALSCM